MLAACSSSKKSDPPPSGSAGKSSTASTGGTAGCASFAAGDVARIAHLTGPVTSKSKSGTGVGAGTTCTYTAADGQDKASILLLGTNRDFFDAVHEANLEDKRSHCADLPDLDETAFGCTQSTYNIGFYRHDLDILVQLEHSDQAEPTGPDAARDKADTIALAKFVLTKM